MNQQLDPSTAMEQQTLRDVRRLTQNRSSTTQPDMDGPARSSAGPGVLAG